MFDRRTTRRPDASAATCPNVRVGPRPVPFVVTFSASYSTKVMIAPRPLASVGWPGTLGGAPGLGGPPAAAPTRKTKVSQGPRAPPYANTVPPPPFSAEIQFPVHV